MKLAAGLTMQWKGLHSHTNALADHCRRSQKKNNLFLYAAIGFMTMTFLRNADHLSGQTATVSLPTAEGHSIASGSVRIDYLAEWQQKIRVTHRKMMANEVKIELVKKKMRSADPVAVARYTLECAALMNHNRALEKELNEYNDVDELEWDGTSSIPWIDLER